MRSEHFATLQDLQRKSLPELKEVLAREKKLAKSQRRLQLLPDGGKKVLDRIAQLEELISARTDQVLQQLDLDALTLVEEHTRQPSLELLLGPEPRSSSQLSADCSQVPTNPFASHGLPERFNQSNIRRIHTCNTTSKSSTVASIPEEESTSSQSIIPKRYASEREPCLVKIPQNYEKAVMISMEESLELMRKHEFKWKSAAPSFQSLAAESNESPPRVQPFKPEGSSSSSSWKDYREQCGPPHSDEENSDEVSSMVSSEEQMSELD